MIIIHDSYVFVLINSRRTYFVSMMFDLQKYY